MISDSEEDDDLKDENSSSKRSVMNTKTSTISTQQAFLLVQRSKQATRAETIAAVEAAGLNVSQSIAEDEYLREQNYDEYVWLKHVNERIARLEAPKKPKKRKKKLSDHPDANCDDNGDPIEELRPHEQLVIRDIRKNSLRSSKLKGSVVLTELASGDLLF